MEDLQVENKDKVYNELLETSKEDLVSYIMNQAVTIENIYHDLQLFESKLNDAIESRNIYIEQATKLQSFVDSILSVTSDWDKDEHLYGGAISTVHNSGDEWLSNTISKQEWLKVPVETLLNEGDTDSE